MSNEAFEKWFTELEPHTVFNYDSPVENFAWWGWQAAQADQAEYIAMRELNNKFKDEALKMAIGAMTYHIEQTRPIEDTNKAIQACKEALARVNVFNNMVSFSTNPKQLAKLLEMNNAPLYNHPVKKPLSEEEIGNMAVNSYTYYDLARAIERHHGIGE